MNQSFDPIAAPPSGTDRSRYALGQTPAGVTVGTTGEAIAVAYQNVLYHRLLEVDPATPEPKEVALKAVVKTPEGYAAISRGTFRAVPTVVSTREGKFTRRPKAHGGALLDLVIRGEVKVRDDVAYEALVDLANAEKPTAAALRQLSDTLAISILLDAGLVATRDQLPCEHLNVPAEVAA